MRMRPKSWLTEHLDAQLLGSTLFKFNVKLPNCGVVSVDMTEDIHVDYEQLESHLQDIPSQFVFWGSVYSEVKAQVSALETRISRRKAFLTRQMVEKAKFGGQKLTEKQVQAFIDADGVDETKVRRDQLLKNTERDTPLTEEELETVIKAAVQTELQQTLPYLEVQLLAASKTQGKLWYMVEALKMRNENCRSLAGFKRQDKEQSGSMT